jgi:cell filamentation protein
MTKISIRFYNDHEVRALWDEDNSKWWFSVLDIIGAINNQDDYQKNRNYWKYLKTKLKKESNELVSLTNQLKLVAPDGKRRLTDVMDSDGVILLAKNIPNNKVNDFLDWFLYSDNTIDGQSRKKAYTLFESGLLGTLEPGSIKYTHIYSEDFMSSRGRYAARTSARAASPLLTPYTSLPYCAA